MPLKDRAAFKVQLGRMARMARALTGASKARLCVVNGEVQSEFTEEGLLESHPLGGEWPEIEAASGCVVLSGDEGHGGQQIAVPMHICDGALLGALMVALPDGVRLKPHLRQALEDIAALAAFLACEWVKLAADRPAFVELDGAAPAADEVLWQLDADMRFTHCGSLTGTSYDWLLGATWEEASRVAHHAVDWESHRADIAARRPYRDFAFEIERDGRRLRLSSSGYPVFAGDGSFAGYRGVTRRSELGARTTKGPKTARFDPVTGLMNRTAWYQCLRRLLPGDQPHTAGSGLVLIDIDHFKTINQRLGHAIADDVLRAVGARLEESIRVTDRLARIGSDEFAVIASDIHTTQDAADLAERLGEAFILPVEARSHTLDVSVTMGLALAPQDGATADELIASAGLAQAYAKTECRGRYQLYAPTMRHRMQDRVVLENDLQKAVAAHELELFYQPQVRLSDNKVVGAEALLRWRHPERGMLAPGQFIEALEQSDYAVSVGNWVVREAARRCRVWHDAGFPIRVGVNLSVAHFATLDIVDLLQETLDETGLAPSCLEMEVTENAVLQSGHGGRALIARLREMGVRVAFDDFGTGYGSLSDLRSIPVDRIKIDRVFIKDSLSSANDASIVRAIISLARNLGLATVAEGVEDEAQEALLRLFGCDEVQGYLYSKPVPAGAFEALLRDNARQEAEDRMEAARDRA